MEENRNTPSELNSLIKTIIEYYSFKKPVSILQQLKIDKDLQTFLDSDSQDEDGISNHIIPTELDVEIAQAFKNQIKKFQ